MNPTEDERLRRIVDSLPSLIGYWDRDLINVFANHAYREYFGRSPEQIRGIHIRELLGEVVYEANYPFIEAVLAGREQVFDRTLTDVHGRVRYTQASYIPDIVEGEVVGFFVQVADVSERVVAEKQRDEAVRLFEIAMDNAPIGKAVLTATGKWLRVNRALCDLTGYSAAELQKMSFRDINHPADLSDADSDLAALVTGAADKVSSVKRYVRKDGSTVWVHRTAVLVPGDQYGFDDVVIAQIQDITAQRVAEEELARLAVTDALTGLANRHALKQRMQAEQSEGRELRVLFVDLDRFKDVNDMFGHAVGDVILVEVAQRLSAAVGDSGLACRIGGDEFVVLVFRNEQKMSDIADTVARSVDGLYAVDGRRVSLSASVGWSCGEGDPDLILAQADRRMYRAKAASSSNRRAGTG
jgi:diguanylate cyclase (GGDEF)-like protein/PAS domain S-box-containing protein